MKRFLQRLQNPITKAFSTKHTSDLNYKAKGFDIQTIRLIDEQGNLLNKSLTFSDEEMSTYRKILQDMIEMEVIDDILNKSQRQGRISFYMTSLGETATVIGSAAGLSPKDMLFTQYR